MAEITCNNCGTLINIKKASKGIVICPNCEVENDCSEQIYDRAMELMASANNEASYKTAAEAFSLVEGFRDADMYRDNCLEQATICYKDATFLRAKTEMMKGDRAGLSFACHLLESISGWKDADEQLGICKMRLEALSGKERNDSDAIYNDSNKGFIKKDRRSSGNTRVKNSSDAPIQYVDFPSFRKNNETEGNNPVKNKSKNNKKKNKTSSGKKKITTIIIASCVGLALIGALVTVYFTVIAPMLRYDDAIEMINNGNYIEGYAILTELGRDNEILENKKDRAEQLLEKEDYDKAYALLEETGGEEKIAESILKRVSPLVEEKKYSEAVKLLSKYKYESLSVMRFNRADELMDNAGYDEAYILLTGNTFLGSEAKRESIKNVSPELKFLGRSKGDIVEIGTFEVDGDAENGPETLKWRIIDVTDDAYMLLSEAVVDCSQFDAPNEKINWTQSYIRKVLNLSYFQSMFTTREKDIILERNVTASPNPSYDTDPGEDSKSMLFLLSCDEFSNLVTDQNVKTVTTKRFDVSVSGLNWWLRTPGAAPGNIAYINASGNMILEGAPANVQFLIRPAMWVKRIG